MVATRHYALSQEVTSATGSIYLVLYQFMISIYWYDSVGHVIELAKFNVTNVRATTRLTSEAGVAEGFRANCT